MINIQETLSNENEVIFDISIAIAEADVLKELDEMDNVELE